MKEIPILFSGQMVRAIMELIKRMTRRTRGLERVNAEPDAWVCVGCKGGNEWVFRRIDSSTFVTVKCPYGQPGDRLWVRETHAFLTDLDTGEGNGYIYRADGWGEDIRWKPSIFIPRRASRITLEVTEVRVERLQDISESDAIAEGVQGLEKMLAGGTDTRDPDSGFESALIRNPVLTFRYLWDEINDKSRDYYWDANPWVWVVEFRRVAP